MYAAAETGLVQAMIGESALAFQEKVENGEETIVGVNAYQGEEDAFEMVWLKRPDRAAIEAQIARVKRFKAERSQAQAAAAIDDLARAANDPKDNVFAKIVDAAIAGVTHGEICACLRGEYGFGQPLIVP